MFSTLHSTHAWASARAERSLGGWCLDGSNRAGVALALESPVKDSVTPATYPMPCQVFEMQCLSHYAGKCPDELLCIRSRKQNAP